MKIKAIFTLGLILLCQSNADAAPCSASQSASIARLIAAREIAGAELAIAKQYVQLETEQQTRLTTAMEQEFQKSLRAVDSFPPSVASSLRSIMQAKFASARTKRTKAQSTALAAVNRVQRSAQSKFDAALQSAGRPLTCQLCSGTTCVVTPTPTPTPSPTVTATPVATLFYLEGENRRTGQVARNGQTLFATPGDAIQYRWVAAGSVGGNSTYRISSGPNNCNWANPGVWQSTMGGAGGDLSTVQACQKGTTYEISYRPFNALGQTLGEQKLFVAVN
jgi:hypothetical protein